MKILDNISPHAHWFLRLALASVFLYHGLGKFPQLTQLAGMMKMPVAMITLVALAETVGSVLILLGGFLKDWMTRLGALLLIPVMLGAIFMVHWGQWNNFAHTESHPMGGMEFQVTLLCIQLYLLIKGNNVKTGVVSASS
jgi:putative oxidoreductase